MNIFQTLDGILLYRRWDEIRWANRVEKALPSSGGFSQSMGLPKAPSKCVPAWLDNRTWKFTFQEIKSFSVNWIAEFLSSDGDMWEFFDSLPRPQEWWMTSDTPRCHRRPQESQCAVDRELLPKNSQAWTLFIQGNENICPNGGVGQDLKVISNAVDG